MFMIYYYLFLHFLDYCLKIFVYLYCNSYLDIFIKIRDCYIVENYIKLSDLVKNIIVNNLMKYFEKI